MARPVANLRLFVGVYPPAALVEAWRSVLGGVDLPPHRLTPVEQVHLTLQFIGDRPVKALDETIESVQRATSGIGAFSLSPQRFIALPAHAAKRGRGPSRLIAVETDGPPGLLELQRRLALRLAKTVGKDPGRKFRPHLTICRFRSPSRLRGFEATLEPAAFHVSRIALMRSTLSPDGAVHHEVAACELEPEG